MSTPIRFRYRAGKIDVYQNVYDPNAPASGSRKGLLGRTKMKFFGRIDPSTEEAAVVALRLLLEHERRGLSREVIEAGIVAFREARPALLMRGADANANANAFNVVMSVALKSPNKRNRVGPGETCPDSPKFWEASRAESGEIVNDSSTFCHPAVRFPQEAVEAVARHLADAIGRVVIITQSPSIARFVRSLLPHIEDCCRQIESGGSYNGTTKFPDPSEEGDTT